MAGLAALNPDPGFWHALAHFGSGTAMLQAAEHIRNQQRAAARAERERRAAFEAQLAAHTQPVTMGGGPAGLSGWWTNNKDNVYFTLTGNAVGPIQGATAAELTDKVINARSIIVSIDTCLNSATRDGCADAWVNSFWNVGWDAGVQGMPAAWLVDALGGGNAFLDGLSDWVGW